MPTSTFELHPFRGLNLVAEDAALTVRSKDGTYTELRKAENACITPTGRVDMRPGMAPASSSPYRNIWQHQASGRVYGTLGSEWVMINPADWSHTVLADIGSADWAYHCDVNGFAVVSVPSGLWVHDGSSARRLALDRPSAPLLGTESGGSLAAGRYGVAVAWLRGAKESPCSLIEWMNAAEASLLRVTLPMAFDPTLTDARIYVTAQNSGALRRYAEVPINQIEIAIPHVDQQTGLEPPFPLMQPMPAGRYVQHWKGRLLVAGIRTLNFSQPLAHHIHNARTDFVHFPQRITFVVGVDGGVWVGQQDHVVFLAGSEPDQWVSQRKAAQRPVPDSAVLLDSDVAGEVAGQTGCALWLAANGYVIGAPDGTLIERHRRKLAGIHGERGTTAVIDGRLVTAVM